MTIEETLNAIRGASTFTQRIQQIRLIPSLHGTTDQATIYSAVARELYMPHLAPDFAYIHESPFYETPHFFAAYDAAHQITEGFTRVAEADIVRSILTAPCTLLVFRTLLGLTKDEFGHSSMLSGAPAGLEELSSSQIDKLERSTENRDVLRMTRAALDRATAQAQVAAKTIVMAMEGELFGDPPHGLRSKQQKPDTQDGWNSVRAFATNGVPLKMFLHQRHYGGAFRQVLDATSTRRGDLIEDAVEALFAERGISFIRTGSHNQADIARRFEVHVTPAPDFVVFDPADDTLKAMLECKGTNNGGTARDKALRFSRLKAESVRLGGIPLIAVLGGIGWARINDALGPVVRDSDGRVFTLGTLNNMLGIAPFPSLITNPVAP